MMTSLWVLYLQISTIIKKLWTISAEFVAVYQVHVITSFIHQSCVKSACYTVKNCKKRGTVSTTTPVAWTSHKNVGCETCLLAVKKVVGGRPGKGVHAGGRPKDQNSWKWRNLIFFVSANGGRVSKFMKMKKFNFFRVRQWWTCIKIHENEEI